MKPSTSLITTLSLLLWFSITTTKPSLASAANEVLDVNEDPLVPGQSYYIVSAIRGAGGGGVIPARTKDSSCSYSIFQVTPDLNRGVPVKFHVPVISTGSTNLEIEFVWKPNCAESSKWGVAYESGSSLSSARLVIGGPQDHPGSNFVNGIFQIKKFTNVNAYKLVFCPKSNVSSSDSCYNVAIGYDQSRQLVLENIDESAFMVVFVKAGVSGNGMSII